MRRTCTKHVVGQRVVTGCDIPPMWFKPMGIPTPTTGGKVLMPPGPIIPTPGPGLPGPKI